MGRVMSKKQTLFGYKLHLLVTLGGVIREYVLAPAPAHDVTLAPELLGGHDDLIVLGNKVYVSASLAEALREEHALHLLMPPRRNARSPQPHGHVSLWNGLRRSRYLWLAKTHLQHILTAAAINFVRVSEWLDGTPLAKTRRSTFTALMSSAI